MGDVIVGDRLLTRREDGVAEYQPVERKQERRHSGNLLHFAGRSVDQLVTEDHKLAVRLRNSRSNTDNFKLLEAREVFGKHNYSFDRQVEWEGSCIGESVMIGDSTELNTDWFLRFLGCWLGDGSAYVGADGGYHVKLAVVTKRRKRNYFRKVLNALGVKYTLQDRGFHFYSKDLCNYLRQFGHAKDKFVDQRWLSLPPDKLTLLLEGLMQSDGTLSTDTYTTASRRLADDVQEIIFKTGAAAIVREVVERRFGEERTAFKVRICGDSLSPKMPPMNHHKVEYIGMVYDVTVPNHVFFCRRNGKASWTGNCWRGKITIEISNTTPCPVKIYSNEGIAQILFLRADDPKYPCDRSYADKNGKYQDQPGLVLPFVE